MVSMGIIDSDNSKYLKNYILRRLDLFAIISLIVWISFFPPPIHQRYHLVTKIFLALVFGLIFIKKHISVFKFSDFPLWVFLVAIGMNVFFAQEKNIALSAYMDLAIPIFLLYYSVSNIFSSESRFKPLAITICILSILVSLIGIIESFFAVNPIYKYLVENSYYQRYIAGFVRPMSTQFNPIVLGSFILASLPFNFFIFKRENSFTKWLGATGLIFCMTVGILTFSRSFFLGLIIMIVFYESIYKKKKNLLILSFSVIILIFMFSYLPYPFKRYGIDWLTTKESGILSTYRLNRYIMVQRIINDHPFVGLGLQHIRTRFHEYYPSQDILPRDLTVVDNSYEYVFNQQIHPYEFMIADNMYLTILGETGIIGFFGFLVFIFSIFRKTWRQLEILTYPSKRKQELLIILSAFIGLLVSMGGYELFYWPSQYIYFCILVGLLEAYYINSKGHGLSQSNA